MDHGRFDAVTRGLATSGTRRTLSALLGSALGWLAVGPGVSNEAVAKKKQRKHQRHKKRRRSGKLRIEGPCGNGSGKANRCKRDRQCCTGYCKKRRCRCRKPGQSCTEDRNCCPERTGRTCQQGACQSAPACSSSCTGCCDAQGGCQPGTADEACGFGGRACTACESPQTCGGGGISGVCGCTSSATCPAGAECGTIPDGCGGTLSCGECAADQVCWEQACVCGDVCAGDCQYSSLQQAINEADNGATIRLCAETYQGAISVDKNLTLVGAGDGEDGTILVSGITIFPGLIVALQELRITGATAGGSGGGIFNPSALTMTGCTIIENSAQFGGGIYNDADATLILTGCTITGNSADIGGGIVNFGGTLEMTGCTVNGNSATSQGGGIHNASNVPLEMTGCTVSGNTVGSNGGGIFNAAGATLEMADCTVSGNATSSFNGGGIYNFGTVTLGDGTTVTGNHADNGNGGGIYNEGSEGGGTSTCSADTNVSGNSPDDCFAISGGDCGAC